MKDVYIRMEKCRICNSKNLVKYLDLGRTPLANSLIEPGDKNNKEINYPLEVLYCEDCYLSQLSIVVNPEILFSRYIYRSSISKTFQAHCTEMVEKIIERMEPNECGLVVDIASNDGCLLQKFRNSGFKTLGIEPAKNLTDIANSKGIETICSFWNRKTANKILKKHGGARIITATNVLAHVDNLNEFLIAVKILLEKNGLFVVEVPYLYDLLTKNEFDTIYHEHLSYFLIKPLKKLYEKFGLSIISIKKYPIHGGSLRIYASKDRLNADKSIRNFIDLENKENLYDGKTYKNFNKRVKKVKKDLLELLKELKNKNKKIAAYGASAKGNTLLNYCSIDEKLISFIIDDTPEKQNNFAPGSRIKIVDASYLEKEKPDYLLLLAWNFTKEIKQKTKKVYKRKIKYIIPIPTVRVE